MNENNHNDDSISTNRASAWDRLTGRLLKKWASVQSPSRHIRGRLLSRASGNSRGWTWIERAYWSQNGNNYDFYSYRDALNPMEARGLSLLSITMCASLQPGLVTHT